MTLAQLRRIEKTLYSALAGIEALIRDQTGSPVIPMFPKPKRKMSAEGRANISRAAKKRWREYRRGKRDW